MHQIEQALCGLAPSLFTSTSDGGVEVCAVSTGLADGGCVHTQRRPLPWLCSVVAETLLKGTPGALALSGVHVAFHSRTVRFNWLEHVLCFTFLGASGILWRPRATGLLKVGGSWTFDVFVAKY